MPAEIRTDVNRPAVPPSGTTITASVDVEPGEKVRDVERHIALCIDTSGSMTGEKIKRARDGALWVFGLLEPEDYITIVGFDSDAELLLRPTKWGDIDREMAQQRVTELSAGGGTNTFEGLRTARDALESLSVRDGTDGDAVKRILLLSDGKDKHHDPPEFEDLAIDIDESGVRIQAAGIGEDYNAETIRTLGTTARGEWTHLEGPGDIENFFGEAVEQARSVVATDARLELDAAPGVEVSDVYRALPQAQEVDLDWEANTAVVKLPDLAEREHQRVVMKIHAPDMDAPAGHVELVEVTLTANGGQATDSIVVEYTDDNEKLAAHNEDIQLAHQETVVKTELGKGDVEAAETQIERMTQVHGRETEVVQNIERQTQLVREGGRAERNRATKLVSDDDEEGRIQK